MAYNIKGVTIHQTLIQVNRSNYCVCGQLKNTCINSAQKLGENKHKKQTKM